ncbi:uncharacterized protein [Panulirus ornatus]|uniref:uncharacterized protein n=1 Tax=Panulirus ornatus TaxID=150431 RepID=UPI003A88BD34
MAKCRCMRTVALSLFLPLVLTVMLLAAYFVITWTPFSRTGPRFQGTPPLTPPPGPSATPPLDASVASAPGTLAKFPQKPLSKENPSPSAAASLSPSATTATEPFPEAFPEPSATSSTRRLGSPTTDLFHIPLTGSLTTLSSDTSGMSPAGTTATPTTVPVETSSSGLSAKPRTAPSTTTPTRLSAVPSIRDSATSATRSSRTSTPGTSAAPTPMFSLSSPRPRALSPIRSSAPPPTEPSPTATLRLTVPGPKATPSESSTTTLGPSSASWPSMSPTNLQEPSPEFSSATSLDHSRAITPTHQTLAIQQKSSVTTPSPISGSKSLDITLETERKSIPTVDPKKLLLTENNSGEELSKKMEVFVLCSTHLLSCARHNAMTLSKALGVTEELLQLTIITSVRDVFLNSSDSDMNVVLALEGTAPRSKLDQTAPLPFDSLVTDNRLNITFTLKNLRQSVMGELADQAIKYRQAKKEGKLPVIHKLLKIMMDVLQDSERVEDGGDMKAPGEHLERPKVLSNVNKQPEITYEIKREQMIDKDTVKDKEILPNVREKFILMENLPDLNISQTFVVNPEVSGKSSQTPKAFTGAIKDPVVLEGFVVQPRAVEETVEDDVAKSSEFVDKNIRKKEALSTYVDESKLLDTLMEDWRHSTQPQGTVTVEDVEGIKISQDGLAKPDISQQNEFVPKKPKRNPVDPKSGKLFVKQEASEGAVDQPKTVAVRNISTKLVATHEASEVLVGKRRPSGDAGGKTEIFHEVAEPKTSHPLKTDENAKESEIPEGVVAETRTSTGTTGGSEVLDGAVREPALHKKVLIGLNVLRKDGQGEEMYDKRATRSLLLREVLNTAPTQLPLPQRCLRPSQPNCIKKGMM